MTESYLANLSLYPGKSELPFLPSNMQVRHSGHSCYPVILYLISYLKINGMGFCSEARIGEQSDILLDTVANFFEDMKTLPKNV